MDQSQIAEQEAGFRLSWPGHDEPATQPGAKGRLAALLRRALPRRDPCMGWPVTLSSPRQG